MEIKKKQIAVRLDESLAHEFKLACLKRKASVNQVLEEMIRKYVKESEDGSRR